LEVCFLEAVSPFVVVTGISIEKHQSSLEELPASAVSEMSSAVSEMSSANANTLADLSLTIAPTHGGSRK